MNNAPASTSGKVSPLYKFSIFFLISFGILTRIVQYAFNPAVWMDEALLALNIMQKTFGGLIGPLDYNQAAPAGFLLVTKTFVQILGQGEYVLRLFPLISSLCAVVLFYKLLRTYVDLKVQLIALALFVFSSGLLRHSVEFKPYSTDILITVVILFTGLSLLSKTLNLPEALRFGCVGACVLWFSFPAVFVLAGVGLTLALLYVTEKRWLEFKHLVCCVGMWITSFFILYIISLSHTQSNVLLEGYWAQHFMPIWPKSFANLLWPVYSLAQMISHPAQIQQNWLGFLIFTVGAVVIFKRNRYELMIWITPIVMTMFASGFHRYPFWGRLLLFYVPVIYVLISEGCLYFWNRSNILSKCTAYILIGIFLFSPTVSAYKHIIEPVTPKDIRPALRYIQDHLQEPDYIYVYYGAIPAFRYYEKRFGFDQTKYVQGIDARADWNLYLKDMNRFAGESRVWILFSHLWQSEEEGFILKHLDQIATRESGLQGKGSSVYLYNFAEGGTN